MRLLQNTWYAAAWQEQLSDRPLARTIATQPLLLFRREDGSPAALSDVCPHRFAPLSQGRLQADVIECPYHGLQFNSSGVCVFNPHGKITSNMNVRTYRIVERHGIAWVWVGAPELAFESSIPDLSFMDISISTRTVRNYIGLTNYRYDILIDNLLDLSHEDYLHRGSFSGGAGQTDALKVCEIDRMVVIERLSRNMPKRPRYEYLGELVDVKYVIRWWPSQVVAFERTYSKAGCNEGPTVTARFCHIGTPETNRTTHYFHAVTRVDNLDDDSVDQRITEVAKSVILGEDGPMLEIIDKRMDGAELTHLDPVILPTDAGAMLVRAVMHRLFKLEA